MRELGERGSGKEKGGGLEKKDGKMEGRRGRRMER
jgi:hypothetical protein